MNILIDIIHPAHVHFFRNAIDELQRRGHTVAVTARKKDVTISLLENFGIPFTILSEAGRGRAGLLRELLVRDWRLWRFCRRFRPDVLTGISGVFVAHLGRITGRASIVWDDTEHQRLAHKITWPAATAVHSPDCYLKPKVEKQFFYSGCHELAYLHPNRFKPDPDVVRSLGIDPERKYCVLRLVSWGAHHDVGQHGIADEKKLRFVERIARSARVYITSEGDLPAELEPYRLCIPVHQIHHVLAFASLCVAEGATVASEAAVLGVPAVYINSLKLGYINMLEDYGLVKQTTKTDQALDMAIELLEGQQIAEQCRTAREKLLRDKIDVTDYIIDTIEKTAANGLNAGRDR